MFKTELPCKELPRRCVVVCHIKQFCTFEVKEIHSTRCINAEISRCKIVLFYAKLKNFVMYGIRFVDKLCSFFQCHFMSIHIGLDWKVLE